MKYFTFFNKIRYQFTDENLHMMNIFTRPSANVTFNFPQTEAFTYFIEDGNSPDDVAKKIYKNDNYFWFVLMQNKITDFYKEWPSSYSHWKDELLKIYTADTFYTPYVLDIQVGDIVSKVGTKKVAGVTLEIDFQNAGVITEVNPYLRSFDVHMIAGQIKENNNYWILRKSSFTYSKITPPNSTSPHILYRKESKLNSAVEFYSVDSSSNNIMISPYSDPSGKNLVASNVENIFEYPDSILSKYIQKQLPGFIISRSFAESKEREWLFKKNIQLIPTSALTTLNNAYTEMFVKDSS